MFRTKRSSIHADEAYDRGWGWFRDIMMTAELIGSSRGERRVVSRGARQLETEHGVTPIEITRKRQNAPPDNAGTDPLVIIMDIKFHLKYKRLCEQKFIRFDRARPAPLGCRFGALWADLRPLRQRAV